MSEDLGRRTYLDVRPVLGGWYVSNKNPTLRGIGSSGKPLRECIVGGPFNSNEEAEAWKVSFADHLESVVWQQRVAG